MAYRILGGLYLFSLGIVVMLNLMEQTGVISVYSGVFGIIRYFLFVWVFAVTASQIHLGEYLLGRWSLTIISISSTISSFRIFIPAWVHLGDFPRKLFILSRF